MLNIEINGQKVQALEGQSVLEALRHNGFEVPTLCHLPELKASGSCRMCVVEVEGARGLVPSCAFPAADGMKIQTHSARVLRARKTIIELLLSDHPDDCLYCVRNKNCELQGLAESLGVRERRYLGDSAKKAKDMSSPSIVRDPSKCILCGRCVRVCEEVQGVSAIDFTKRGSKTVIGTAFSEGLNLSSCVNCGQCIVHCPTGALRERSSLKQVLDALQDPTVTVVAQHAPAVSVTIAEEFKLAPKDDYDGIVVAALRRLGFKYVFDTSFTADLTIMEEGSELVERIKNNGPLPMITSCSPAWIKFAEEFYPEFLPNLSTCKSPQQMMGAVTKTFFAKKMNLDPAKIFSVSIMPCVAKKFEAERPEMGRDGVMDVDAVLTTRELARLIRMRSLDLKRIQPEAADNPFGERSTAGKIFGASGGVMEAAIRSAYFLLTKKELEVLDVKAVRGMEGVKEAVVDIAGTQVRVAVANGLGNARLLLDEVKAGRKKLHFIEVMSCPGGCIAGGGQPYGADIQAIKARMRALYRMDSEEQLRVSHKNESVQRLYKEFLGQPLGHKSHELLHTQYEKREVVL